MQKIRHFYFFFMYFNTIYMIAETGTDPGIVFPRTELAEGQLKAGHVVIALVIEPMLFTLLEGSSRKRKLLLLSLYCRVPAT